MANPIKITVNINAYDRELIRMLANEEPVVSTHLITHMALRAGLESLTNHPGSLRAAIIAERAEAKEASAHSKKLMAERAEEIESCG